MSRTESYLDKTFTVADPDARIRKAANLLAYEQYVAGDPLPVGSNVGDVKRIPQNTQIKIDAIKILPTGSSGRIVFVRAVSTDGGTVYGWTSSGNLRDRFVNETLGEVKPMPSAGQFGPNAAWSGGAYIGQRTLVSIVDGTREIERIALETLDAYIGLVTAAASDGVQIAINSGFRSYAEQRYLFDGYKRKLPGFNKAAPPGSSKHQSGIAFDILIAGGQGNPVYDWLVQHAPANNFIRTVSGEPWHWEYDPSAAAAAMAAHTFKTPSVID